MPPKIEHDSTMLPICPHCGSEQEDWYEMNHKQSNCEQCDELFSFEINQTITFTTQKIHTHEPPTTTATTTASENKVFIR